MSEKLELIQNLLKEKQEQCTITANFWMVRTESGRWYDDFVKNNYIAIGWNEVPPLSTFTINKSNKQWRKSVCEKIRSLYSTIESTKKIKPGYILSQLIIFENEMKVGDYVLIPSELSFKIYIGKIKSLNYNDVKHTENCKFECSHKRRYLVEWIKEVPKKTLNGPILSAFYSQHTVLNMNNHADSICKLLYTFYIYEGNSNFILPVKMKRNLSAIELFSFSEILPMADEIGKLLNINFQRNDLDIKVILQSPGDFQIICKNSVGIVGLLLLSMIFESCSNNETTNNTLNSTENDINIINLINDINNDDSNNSNLFESAAKIQSLSNKKE